MRHLTNETEEPFDGDDIRSIVLGQIRIIRIDAFVEVEIDQGRSLQQLKSCFV